MVVLVSSCLTGTNCRYKGDNCKNERVLEFLKGNDVICVCPEVMGGLATPRPPAEIVGDRIVNKEGIDVTEEYMKGARKTLEIAIQNHVDLCILKSKSPSCGLGRIYDGTFTGGMVDGDGVTAALLKKNGFKVMTETDLDKI